MYAYSGETSPGRRHLLISAYEQAKKELESIQELQLSEKKHSHSKSTQIKHKKKLPENLIKKIQHEQMKESQAFMQYKHQISKVIQNNPKSPTRSHSLSTLNSRLSKIKNFRIAKEHLEHIFSKDLLEKITKKQEFSSIKNKESIECKRQSAFKLRKITAFQENSSFTNKSPEISLLQKIIIKSSALQKKKKSILSDFHVKMRKKQEKQEILQEKMAEKKKEFIMQEKQKNSNIEKKLEKIEKSRNSHKSLLNSYSQYLNSKHKSKVTAALKNNEVLKQQQLQERSFLINKIMSAKFQVSQMDLQRAENLLRLRSSSIQKMKETEKFRQNLCFINSCRSLNQLETHFQQMFAHPRSSTPPSSKSQDSLVN